MQCRSGQCFCRRFFVGPHCEDDFRRLSGHIWGPFRAAACAVHVAVVLATLATFPRPWQWCGALRVSWNPRHAAAGLNALASVFRALWLLAPVSDDSSFVAARLFDALMLRLPQVLWIAVVLCLLLVWTHVTRAIRNNTITRTHKAVAAVIIVAASASAPVSAYASLNYAVDPVIETGGPFDVAVRGLYAAVVVFVAGWALVSHRQLSQLANFLGDHGTGAHMRLHRAIQNITATVVTLCVGALTCVAVCSCALCARCVSSSWMSVAVLIPVSLTRAHSLLTHTHTHPPYPPPLPHCQLAWHGCRNGCDGHVTVPPSILFLGVSISWTTECSPAASPRLTLSLSLVCGGRAGT